MKGIFLLLGSNLGDPKQNLQQALRLVQTAEVKILESSSIYQTEPWGNSNQEWFLNVVIRIDTLLSPIQLLAHCQHIEKQMGRERLEKWGSRIIDIDILYYDDLKLTTDELSIPHPGIPQRKFTLIPLCEIAADEKHPVSLHTQKELLELCTDELHCNLTDIEINS